MTYKTEILNITHKEDCISIRLNGEYEVILKCLEKLFIEQSELFDDLCTKIYTKDAYNKIKDMFQKEKDDEIVFAIKKSGNIYFDNSINLETKEKMYNSFAQFFLEQKDFFEKILFKFTDKILSKIRGNNEK